LVDRKVLKWLITHLTPVKVLLNLKRAKEKHMWFNKKKQEKVMTEKDFELLVLETVRQQEKAQKVLERVLNEAFDKMEKK
jgi:hypothetical protein